MGYFAEFTFTKLSKKLNKIRINFVRSTVILFFVFLKKMWIGKFIDFWAIPEGSQSGRYSSWNGFFAGPWNLGLDFFEWERLGSVGNFTNT